MKAETTDKIYRALLDSFELSTRHRDQLTARGWSPEDIEFGGYKSFPRKKAHIIKALAAEFPDDLIGVAGFYMNGASIALAGCEGIAVPILSTTNLVTGIKIRSDKPIDPSRKYVFLSSSPNSKDSKSKEKYPQGTAAKTSIHCPQGFDPRDKIVRITEGEIKANIATRYSGIYTCAVSGISHWRGFVDVLRQYDERPIVRVAYDADKSYPIEVVKGGGQSREDAYQNGGKKEVEETTEKAKEEFPILVEMTNLMVTLEREGFRVEVEDWPIEDGKGIDDLILAGKEEKIRLYNSDEKLNLIRNHHRPSRDEELSAAANEVTFENFVYIIELERFIDRKTGQYLKKSQFDDRWLPLFPKKTMTASRAFMLDPFQDAVVDGIEYLPKGREFFTNEKGQRMFNTWLPSRLAPRAGNVAPFLEHCEWLFPIEAECEFFLDYLCFLVQKEGQKATFGILIQGGQGLGKSIFAEIISRCLGRDNVSMPSNDDVHSQYNSWLANTSVVVIEELMAAGRMELMNKLKPLITQPTFRVSEKFIPSYETKNVANFVMFTNHENAIVIGEDDRRYACLFSDAKRDEKGGDSYYEALWNYLDEGGDEAILHFLLQRDISNFNHKGSPPRTSGRQRAIEASLLAYESFTVERISEERWPFYGDIVRVPALRELKDSPYFGLSNIKISNALQTAGAIKAFSSGKLRNPENQKVEGGYWIIRNLEKWKGKGTKEVFIEASRTRSPENIDEHADGLEAETSL